MSTPTQSKDVLLRATRQQLDELDALIQRMLALPVVETPEDLAGPIDGGSGDEAVTQFAPPVRSLPAPEGESKGGPMKPGGNPVAFTYQGEDGPSPANKPDAVAPIAAPSPSPLSPETTERADRELQERDEPGEDRLVAPRILQWYLWPVVGLNRSFDLSTRLIGPPGLWLRGEQGRTFLGFTGLALLTSAAVLAVLDWILGNW